MKKARLWFSKRITRCVCLLAVAALLLLCAWNLKIGTVTVNGEEFYTEEAIRNRLFATPLENNLIYAWLNNRFGDAKQIPFVAGYTLDFDGKDVTVTVYEKQVVGYIDYMGSHMYFDKDGTVIESTSELHEGVPLITGLTFDYIVLYRPLPLKNENAFTEILNLTQLISRYEIPADRISFDSSFRATLYVGGVQVLLGDKTEMEDKVAELCGMLKELDGLSGTLHLENYDRTAMNPGYSFVRSEPETGTDSAETGTETGQE